MPEKRVSRESFAGREEAPARATACAWSYRLWGAFARPELALQKMPEAGLAAGADIKTDRASRRLEKKYGLPS
jgi:hypothetical protein